MADTIINALTQYYGLDWAGMVLGLTGFYLITKQHQIGFLFQALASVTGCSVALMAGQIGFVAYNTIFMVIASYGYFAWAQQQQAQAAQIIRRTD